MPIVTSTYRYKPPPKRKGRKLAEITGPAIVTIDPKTRAAKKGRRPPGEGVGTAAKVEIMLPHPVIRVGEPDISTPSGPRRDSAVTANDDGSRTPAIVGAKGGRRLRRQKAAAQVDTENNPPIGDRAGQPQPNPPPAAARL